MVPSLGTTTWPSTMTNTFGGTGCPVAGGVHGHIGTGCVVAGGGSFGLVTRSGAG